MYQGQKLLAGRATDEKKCFLDLVQSVALRGKCNRHIFTQHGKYDDP